MDIVMLLTFIVNNQEEILDIAGRIVMGASALAAISPTLSNSTKLNRLFNFFVNVPALAVGGAKPKESDGLLLGAIKLLSKKK